MYKIPDDPSILTDFTIETRLGFRHVEFDPDAFRFKDVRILVDGTRVAEMPFPKPATPVHRVAFDLDGHELVAVAYLTPHPTEYGADIVYDLFAEDRSLRDGATLDTVLARAAAPGRAYPNAFKVIDMTLTIVPSASAPGLGIGVIRSGDDLGLGAMVGVLALLLLVVGVGTAVARWAWLKIRARDDQSVTRRAFLGWSALLGSYVATFGLAIGLILLVRPPT